MPTESLSREDASVRPERSLLLSLLCQPVICYPWMETWDRFALELIFFVIPEISSFFLVPSINKLSFQSTNSLYLSGSTKVILSTSGLSSILPLSLTSIRSRNQSFVDVLPSFDFGYSRLASDIKSSASDSFPLWKSSPLWKRHYTFDV